MNFNAGLKKISHLDFVLMLSHYALSIKDTLTTKTTSSNEFWYLKEQLLGAKNKNGYYADITMFNKFKREENVNANRYYFN